MIKSHKSEVRSRFRMKVHYLVKKPMSFFLLPQRIRKSLLAYYISLYMGDNVSKIEIFREDIYEKISRVPEIEQI